VNDGVTEVSIPIVLVTGSQAIAGAELEFSFSSGLEYVRYQPATGLENPVFNSLGANHYVGFFSLDNKYVPTNERLSFGALVFSYTGAQAQSVSVTEISLHTKTGSGAATEVTTQKTTKAITIPVTRIATGAGDDGSGSGANGSAGNPSNPSTSTSAGNTQTSATTTDAGTAGQTDAVELVADDEARTLNSSLTPAGSTADTAIPDAGTPLSGGLLPVDQEQIPLLAGAALIAAVIAASALYYFFSKRKERERAA
jgi:hypothetical protein